MRPTRIGPGVSHVALAFAVLLLGSAASTHALAQNEPIELRNQYMDWLDVVEQGATFEWSVDVTNNTDAPVRMQVILDLLDDDDQPINRDEQNNPNDLVTITVQPHTTVAVEQQGVIAYDRAAEVVTYRHRHRVIQ